MKMETQLLMLFARLKKEAERCRVYAMRAKKDNRPQLSALFQAISASQDMQAQRFLVQLRGGVDSTVNNERLAFAEELPGLIEEYTAMLAEAREVGSRALETGFLHSSAVQERNLELHRQLERLPRETEYHVCNFCGYIAAGEPPDNCPVCTAPKIRFVKIEAG